MYAAIICAVIDNLSVQYADYNCQCSCISKVNNKIIL